MKLETLASILTDRRKSLKLTQHEVAKKVGVTRNMINMVENGSSHPDRAARPSLDTLIKWIEALDLRIEIKAVDQREGFMRTTDYANS